MKEILLTEYDIEFSQPTTVQSEMTVKVDNDYSFNKAFIHSFDYILFSHCSLCSCFFFFAMFMAGEGDRSSICSKNEIITMNKYCFHKRRYSSILLHERRLRMQLFNVFKTNLHVRSLFRTKNISLALKKLQLQFLDEKGL